MSTDWAQVLLPWLANQETQIRGRVTGQSLLLEAQKQSSAAVPFAPMCLLLLIPHGFPGLLGRAAEVMSGQVRLE